jgi:A/G-specific adenine glycosylase
MPASAAKQLLDERCAAKQLLDHYDANARALPWRSPPGEAPTEPYKVWLSEVMLQQTTVATVKPRFRRFIERWPTIEALAAAPDEQVLSEWAGLGYYARARNLIACARTVAAIGGFPRTEAELRELPGLGAYTAAAIAAIAFGERAVVVDTNVARVVARYHGIERTIEKSRNQIRDLADSMTPWDRPGDYAQAMMDLGATICRPKRPLCGECPLSPDCKALSIGRPEAFPATKIKRHRPHRHGLAWWVERNDSIWLVRRPAKGMLGGMAALPGPEWSDEAPTVSGLATISHGFTHFTLDLLIAPRTSPPEGEGWWQPIDRIGEAGLPTLYARAVDAVLARKDALAA